MFNISQKIIDLSEKALKKCEYKFAEISNISEHNSQKVLYAFQQNKVSDSHFNGTTGYGYDDRGREVLDKVFADVFCAEDALVRHFMVSGTHAITVMLFGLLRPGDKMLSATGKPYDTLMPVIGEKNDGTGSLRDFSIIYDEIELKDGKVDIKAVCKYLENSKVKVLYIQRSRGYSIRPTMTIADIKEVCTAVKAVDKDIIIAVDNCYGEFVEKDEPLSAGADIIAGSLIKNPGGALAAGGGYIAGRKDLVKKCAYRLTCPGLGKKVGATHNLQRDMFRGLFLAPSVVAEALKTAVFAASLFNLLGFETIPNYDDTRGDIVQTINLGSKERLCAFCEGIQKGAPVDSFVTPEPWDMPGYDVPVIMAAGAFIQGSSIELSADGPIKPPFAVHFQGGISFDTAKIGILTAAQIMSDRGLI